MEAPQRNRKQTIGWFKNVCAFVFVLAAVSKTPRLVELMISDEEQSKERMSVQLRGSMDIGMARSLQDKPSDSTCDVGCCSEFTTELCGGDENEWLNALPFAVQILLMALLILLSALFSGLTLGLMGLDKTGLEIVMEGENESSALAAKKIYPIRSNGNLLLCTLLLGNVLVNSMLSILLSDYAGGLVGLAVSTMLIVIFGEIVPQALCSRYALKIGSMTIPLVRVILVLLYPIAAPLAFLLNKALGDELATTYSSAEMRKLLEIHVKEGRFDQETAEAMTGALKYKDISVKEVMTPLEHTFMLDADEKLNFPTIATIFKTGYSRIPVYEVTVNNIVGLLFVKDLIFIDPEDETPVRNFVQIFGRGVHVVWPDDKLGDVLRELKRGRSHMALVRDVNNDDETDPFYEIKGIITLEDIIEEIIGDEIVDETDAFVDGTHLIKVNREDDFDWGRLTLLDSKIVESKLSYEETRAVTAHLRGNYTEAVALLTDKQLCRLVAETSIAELQPAEQDIGTEIPNDLMYKKGMPTDTCTFILSGKMTVLAGLDRFRSDVSSWTVLASSALRDSSYVPDFSAFVSGGPCRCLQFKRKRFADAVDASSFERRRTSLPHSTSSRELDDKNSTEAVSQRHLVERTLSEKWAGDSPKASMSSRKRQDNQNRRRKLIEAFLNRKDPRGLNRSFSGDDNTTQPPLDKEERKVGFGTAMNDDLNTLLSDGGLYHPKRVSEGTRSLSTDVQTAATIQSVATDNGNGIEFLEVDTSGSPDESD